MKVNLHWSPARLAASAWNSHVYWLPIGSALCCLRAAETNWRTWHASWGPARHQGYRQVPNLAVYAASKAYVLSFRDALFQELSGTKIMVTTLCPGVTDTGMVHGTSLSSLPGMMIMDAKTVAQEGYRACMAGKPVHVAGIANELAVQWIKYQPRWLMRAFGSVLGKGRDA
jgi:NAD(P)-dependent dehydrogenase (short-subunit alcohol dehydrogenase family)